MSRFLLDTNMISNVVKPEPSPALLHWWSQHDDGQLFVSTLTLAEIRRGILKLPQGRKREALQAWFDSADGPPTLFGDRILPFDEAAASIWARLMADGRSAGRPRNALDMIIAATAYANDCVIVTDNEKDFEGINYINPLRAD